MNAPFRLLFLLLVSGTSKAEEEGTTEACLSPDSRHRVALRKVVGEQIQELAIMGRDPEKPLLTEATGGYVPFRLATQPENFKCLWRADLRFVAVFTRGTKRTGDTSLYVVTGKSAGKVRMPDLMGRVNAAVPGGFRSLWIEPAAWSPEGELRLAVRGTPATGPDVAFQFKAVVRLTTDKKGAAVGELKSFEKGKPEVGG